MNCRPGDLAINVGGLSRFLGEIYTVLRAYDGPWPWDTPVRPSWWVRYGNGRYHAFDCDLRPIRDPGDDATDESLLWAPAPEKVLA
jgi:hypothetical protein